MSMKAEVSRWNFNEKPLIVFWETTKACLLACSHCRAEAVMESLPLELTAKEGINLIDQVLEFGYPYPTLIFTGGDVFMRKEIFALMSYVVKNGMRVAAAPSVTHLLTLETLRSLKTIGVNAISISLDGAKPETHDGIRGVKGTFYSTLNILKEAIDLGLRVQVNTTVMNGNCRELADIFHLLKILNVPTWEVFFLIRTGRGAELQELDALHYEDVMNFLYEASYYGITIRTTEGPYFRRVVSQRLVNKIVETGMLYIYLTNKLRKLEGTPNGELKVQTTGTRDGRGIVFVAYNGDVYPRRVPPCKAG